MFLRNYDNYYAGAHLLSSVFSNSSYGQTAEFKDGYINQKTTNSALESVAFISSAYDSRYLYPPFNFSAAGICLGDGNAEVTYDDYKLSGNVITNKLTTKKDTLTYDDITKKYTRELICAYYNDTANAITIAEWGLFRGNPASTSMTFNNSSADVVLVYREVLMEPIHIEAGETATIKFSLSIPTCSH